MAVYISKDDGDALAHYGVLGMKWGVRRYRNKDGSLTNAGKKRYGRDLKRAVKKGPEYGDALSVMSKETPDIRSSESKQAYRDYYKSLNDIGEMLNGAFSPEETEVFQKAANRVTKELVSKELKKNPNEYTTEKAIFRLEEYMYVDGGGYKAGMKAFNKKYPDYANLNRKSNKLLDKYISSISNDANKLLDPKIADKQIGLMGNRTYREFVQDILHEKSREDLYKGRSQ